jgi:hypothetical protein
MLVTVRRCAVAASDGTLAAVAVAPDILIARLAARQWGVVSLADLRAAGLSANAVAHRVRGGRLHPLHRAVYAVGHPAPPSEGRFLAAVLACGPGAALSHVSAAALWDLVPWDGRRPEVTAAACRAHPGIRTHRSALLDATDVTRHRGIPVTAPARTLLDVAAALDERALRRAVREAQARYRVTVGQLRAVLDRHAGRRGARALARIVATGPAPTRSELEDVVLDLVLDAGFPHPQVNVPLVVGGRLLVPDFRWPDARVIVEADGAAWHEGSVAREDDAGRQALLERCGERVLRVTWRQAVLRPRETLARIEAAGVARCRERRVRTG